MHIEPDITVISLIFTALPVGVLWYNKHRSKMVKRLEKVKQAVMA